MHPLLLSSLLLLPGLALAQAPQAYTIKGRIGRLNAPAQVYLMREGRLDSAALKNGVFELKGTTDFPKQTYLLIRYAGGRPNLYGSPQERLTLFLEGGTTVIDSPDSLHHARLRGGPATTDYQRYEASLAGWEARMKPLKAAFARATAAERESPAFASLRTQQEALFEELPGYGLAFIKANPASWVSLALLWQLQILNPPTYAQMAPLYAALSPALKATPPGRNYGQLLEGLKVTAVGALAPDISLPTPEGRTVSLRDYRGKYVLVDFWASWCGPCRQENPNVLRAYQQFKDRPFDVLGISLDDEKGRAKWLKAIAEDQLPWTQLSDLRGWQNQAARQYGVQSIPQNFLIDPQGRIVAVNLRGEELLATLSRLIK